MRLTYKKLAELVSEKLTTIGINHTKVQAQYTRLRSDDYEGGAAIIMFFVYINENDYFNLLGFQWLREIEEIINNERPYIITIETRHKFYLSLNDAEVTFKTI